MESFLSYFWRSRTSIRAGCDIQLRSADDTPSIRAYRPREDPEYGREVEEQVWLVSFLDYDSGFSIRKRAG
jgi:hypothetical protein